MASLSELASPSPLPVPLCVGGGELARTLVIVIALTADLLFGASLSLGGQTLIRRQTPLASAWMRSSPRTPTRHLLGTTSGG
jgi:hypothetical protein